MSHNPRCCKECAREKDSDYQPDDRSVIFYDCIDRECPCHTKAAVVMTSPGSYPTPVAPQPTGWREDFERVFPIYDRYKMRAWVEKILAAERMALREKIGKLFKEIPVKPGNDALESLAYNTGIFDVLASLDTEA